MFLSLLKDELDGRGLEFSWPPKDGKLHFGSGPYSGVMIPLDALLPPNHKEFDRNSVREGIEDALAVESKIMAMREKPWPELLSHLHVFLWKGGEPTDVTRPLLGDLRIHVGIASERTIRSVRLTEREEFSQEPYLEEAFSHGLKNSLELLKKELSTGPKLGSDDSFLVISAEGMGLLSLLLLNPSLVMLAPAEHGYLIGLISNDRVAVMPLHGPIRRPDWDHLHRELRAGWNGTPSIHPSPLWVQNGEINDLAEPGVLQQVLALGWQKVPWQPWLQLVGRFTSQDYPPGLTFKGRRRYKAILSHVNAFFSTRKQAYACSLRDGVIIPSFGAWAGKEISLRPIFNESLNVPDRELGAFVQHALNHEYRAYEEMERWENAPYEAAVDQLRIEIFGPEPPGDCPEWQGKPLGGDITARIVILGEIYEFHVIDEYLNRWGKTWAEVYEVALLQTRKRLRQLVDPWPSLPRGQMTEILVPNTRLGASFLLDVCEHSRASGDEFLVWAPGQDALMVQNLHESIAPDALRRGQARCRELAEASIWPISSDPWWICDGVLRPLAEEGVRREFSRKYESDLTGKA